MHVSTTYRNAGSTPGIVRWLLRRLCALAARAFDPTGLRLLPGACPPPARIETDPRTDGTENRVGAHAVKTLFRPVARNGVQCRLFPATPHDRHATVMQRFAGLRGGAI
jgi:hypothetical protein